MKKIFKFLLCFILLFSLSGCGVKKALTNKEFVKMLQDEGYTVNDVTKIVEDQKLDHVATADNRIIKFEYYIFKEEKDAKKAFENNKKVFDASKKKASEKSSDNYQKYTQDAGSTYNSITRIKNTFVYASVSMEHKKDLKKILKKLGY